MEKDIKQNIEEMFSRLQEVMWALYSRWQEEKEYESFEEYEKVLHQHFDCYAIYNMREASFLKAMKRPFGIAFKYGTWYVEFLTSSSVYRWRAKEIK